MRLAELKDKIIAGKILDSLFSIDDGLKPNAHILFKNYSKWEYFFLDERGYRQDFSEFENEGDAFDHFWKRLEIESKYPESIKPKNLGL
jgi:hypothetical protein